MTIDEKKLCRTCKYGKKPEYHKPCVVYRDDCQLYEPIEEMTPEKAINMLKSKMDGHTDTSYEWAETVRMAIKALEQESITWIVGKDNCQVAVKNMPIDKMQKICAIIGEEEQQPCEDAISREDAIGIVAHIKEMHINDRERYQINYGTICDIDLALQQLPSVTPSYNSIKTEQQPCEDCVNLKALNEAITELTYWHPTTDGRLEVGDAFERTVYKVEDVWRIPLVLPSVKPQRPPGKWLDKKMTIKGAHGMAYGRYACSVCKKKFPNKSNYCPDCGAKMGAQNETNN